MFDENRLFIFDKSLHSVFIFDKDGKFLHTIDRKGNGPGEYTQLNAVCLDASKKQLILVPDSPLKLYYMDYDGNLLHEIDRAKNWYTDVSCQDGNVYATSILPNIDNDFCYLYSINENGEEKCFFNYPEIFPHTYFAGGSYMTNTKNLNFTINCENFIYEVVDKQVIKKYEIDFGKYNLPDTYKRRKDISSEEFFRVCRENNYIFGIVEVVDGENYLAFKTNNSSVYIYSKADDLLTKITFILDSKYAISWNRMLHIENMPNSIAFMTDAASVLVFREATKFWENENLAEQKKNFWNLTETMQFEDNPVLMIYNFK
jgi:hypothetical protein